MNWNLRLGAPGGTFFRIYGLLNRASWIDQDVVGRGRLDLARACPHLPQLVAPQANVAPASVLLIEAAAQ
jgi:hypothetical protein